jgi:uncharacterized protein (TIGR02594 family)
MPSPLAPRTTKTTVNGGFGYYPFGMMQEGRQFVGGMGYRWGFQGQETDNEIKGKGNIVNYRFRMDDTRLGRFFAVDPLTKDYAWYSPYQFSGNKVIHCIELEGLEEWPVSTIDGGNDHEHGPWANREKAQENYTQNEIKSDSRFKYLSIAGSQIGTTEIPGVGNNPRITEYHKIGGQIDANENVPWCASFVNYCLFKGNPTYPRTNNTASKSWYIQSTKLQLEQVDVPYYGSFMVRSDNGLFNGGPGHVALIVGKVGNGYAQLGGNQAVPGSANGTTVNVVLREATKNVRYYHFTFLPKVPLMGPLFTPATNTPQPQLGTDR